VFVEPKPLLRLNEVLPGSENEGKFLFTPPLCEQVPRPEFELNVPLLHKLPADAGATDTSELARNPIATATKILFFISSP
jgi:hypothetical protein